MSAYRLTPTAQNDLVRIRDYYLAQADSRVARRILSELVDGFRFLATNPRADHKREDLAETRPVLFWPVRDYLIVYKLGTVPVEVVMIARSSQDVSALIIARNT